MSSAADTNPSNNTTATLVQLEAVREKIRDAQQKLMPPAEPLTLDIGLDPDLLDAFNAGVDQQLVLLIQIVRLLRQKE